MKTQVKQVKASSGEQDWSDIKNLIYQDFLTCKLIEQACGAQEINSIKVEINSDSSALLVKYEVEDEPYQIKLNAIDYWQHFLKRRGTKSNGYIAYQDPLNRNLFLVFESSRYKMRQSASLPPKPHREVRVTLEPEVGQPSVVCSCPHYQNQLEAFGQHKWLKGFVSNQPICKHIFNVLQTYPHLQAVALKGYDAAPLTIAVLTRNQFEYPVHAPVAYKTLRTKPEIDEGLERLLGRVKAENLYSQLNQFGDCEVVIRDLFKSTYPPQGWSGTPAQYEACRTQLMLLLFPRERYLTFLNQVCRNLGLPDYFPSSSELGNWMIEVAQLRAGETVNEPAAGNGMLLDLLKSASVPLNLMVGEIQYLLREILRVKGYEPVATDFLELKAGEFSTYSGHLVERVDVILTNAPFCQSEDFIAQATQLARRVVLVIGDDVLTRQEERFVQMQTLLKQLNAQIIPIPAGMFRTCEIPVWVKASMVLINNTPDYSQN